jgi:predicted metal-dependent hydrolase
MVKTVKIADRPISYQVLNRKIKYPRLEFKTGGLVIILPEAASNDVQLIHKYRKWIITKIDYINKAMIRAAKTQLVLARTPLVFKALITKLIRVYSKELGVKPRSIFVRVMRSKWASLSANHNLTLIDPCISNVLLGA